MAIDRENAHEVRDDGLLLEGGVHFSSGTTDPDGSSHVLPLVGDRYYNTLGNTHWKYTGTLWLKVIETDEDSNGASPGFIFGDGGNTVVGAYFSNEGVPSNVVGVPIGVNTPRLKQITVRNENSQLWSVTIEEHDGTTFTPITTVVVSPASRGQIFDVDFALTKDKELAARVAPTSANAAKNGKVQCIIKGTVT